VGEIFKKIPYASPPTGARRWKKPVPPEPWNYTLDGTFFGPGCAQVPSSWEGYKKGLSEDCLTVNIYTSSSCRVLNAKCPVAVYIHGGSGLVHGVQGFPDESHITNFVSHGVILVTFSYRLGVFGAMALGDENALPANLNMHDVRESLRFIRKEIHSFGGDKDQVTLLGYSTGASITFCLVFSPAFNNPGETPLFARAIGMSTPMNLDSEEKQVNRSHVVAKKLGCMGTAQEIIDCLLPLSTSEILNAAFEIGTANLFSPTHISGLALAGELMPIHNMMELRDNHEENMKKLDSRMPTKLLLGTIVNEFGVPAYSKYKDIFKKSMTYQKGVNQVMDVLGVRNVQECTDKYFGDVKSGKLDPGYDTLSQSLFTSTALFAGAQVHAGGEVYLYQLDYPHHAMHADHLGYVMKNRDDSLDENEQWISRVFPVYITNFIRGLPLAPDWQPFNPELMNYYSINKNFNEGISPEITLGYHHHLIKYYNDMIKFDDQLTNDKQMILNAPIQMKKLPTEFIDTHSEPFNLRDLLFYSAFLSVILCIIVQLYQYCQSRQSSQESSRLIR
ncbi:hypothetical protein PENTCL1PPCAC_917, partial [Pristionchus entomophagus]